MLLSNVRMTLLLNMFYISDSNRYYLEKHLYSQVSCLRQHKIKKKVSFNCFIYMVTFIFDNFPQAAVISFHFSKALFQ